MSTHNSAAQVAAGAAALPSTPKTEAFTAYLEAKKRDEAMNTTVNKAQDAIKFNQEHHPMPNATGGRDVRDFLFAVSDEADQLHDGMNAMLALAHLVEVADDRNAPPPQHLAALIQMTGEALQHRTAALQAATAAQIDALKAANSQGGEA